MVIKIKKKLYFKPRFCPECGKVCLFCRHYLSLRCGECHKEHNRRRKNRNKHIKQRTRKKLGLSKYTSNYQRRRKREIKQHPYCSLCGTDQNLTTHHVGGGCDHLTVLCDECHQAYERWNNKRKDREWKKNRLTTCLNSWRSTTKRARCRCLMYYYRTRPLRVLERQEAPLAVSKLVNENITN